MKIDGYLPMLKEEIGEIAAVREFNPGVYCIETPPDGQFVEEYFVVLDTAPMAEKVRNYGKKMDGLRIYAQADDASGWRIVQYEISKTNIRSGKDIPEYLFRDMTLHAMELHPEYFGTFPVPYQTPHGYTLRYRTLDNGICWLETSEGKELLSICFPIWNAELSAAATLLGEIMESDRKMGIVESTCYIFFSPKAACIPVYELMETRGRWDGVCISRYALMNAIWEFMPEYALHLNGRKNTEGERLLTELLKLFGVDVLPEPNENRRVYMYPDAGTDFLLLK